MNFILLPFVLFAFYFPVGYGIIGGIAAKDGQFPYIAFLRHHKNTNSKVTCGASIIHSRWALTSAHCVIIRVKRKFITKMFAKVEIVVGTLYPNMDGEVYSVGNIRIHPDFVGGSPAHDIALLHLSTSINFNEKVHPIQLPCLGVYNQENSGGVVAGWGYTSDKFRLVSENLLYFEITVVNNQKCRQYYTKIIPTDTQFCAAAERASICKGDSGNPMVVNGIQFGIASFGPAFCTSGVPIFFTDVSNHTALIKSTLEFYYDNICIYGRCCNIPKTAV